MVSFAFRALEIMIIYKFLEMGDRFFNIHLSRLLFHLRSAVGAAIMPFVEKFMNYVPRLYRFPHEAQLLYIFH